jgi:hypothetical protein
MKKGMRAYKAFDFNVSDLKKLIRKARSTNANAPVEFVLNLDDQRFKFTLFENDVLSDDFVTYVDGKPASKKGEKGEINTYAGYVNDHPKNALRLFISDKRISGFFQIEQGEYVIGHLGDYSLSEKTNNADKKQLYIVKREDEYSSRGTNFCANVATKVRKSTGARLASPDCANEITCKFLRVAIETDYEFASNILQIANLTGASVTDAIQDMVNQVDYVYFRDLAIRIKCTYMGVYLSNTDPYTATTINIYGEFIDKVKLEGIDKDIIHMLTGRPLGGFLVPGSTSGGIGYNYGQANQNTLCNSFDAGPGDNNGRPASLNSIVCNGQCVKTSNNRLNYSDACAIMAHEMGHVLGADHDDVTTPKSIMDFGEGKGDKMFFSPISVVQIENFACNKTCLSGNVVDASYSNRFQLRLNGNPINTTPVFINGNTKVVTIPPNSTNPLITLKPNTTSFYYSNPNVTRFYSTSLSTSFAMGAVSSFVLSVSAQEHCRSYYWNVPFVYSAGGARIATTLYPVPANETLAVDSESSPDAVIESIGLFDDKSRLQMTVEPDGPATKQQINTSGLKSGVYFLHIVYKNGQVIKKRFVVSHE